MTEIVQKLRTEFVIDTDRAVMASGRLRNELHTLEKETRGVVDASKLLVREFDDLDKQAEQIRQIERDLATARPTGSVGGLARREIPLFNNRWAGKDIQRIDDIVDPMLKELDLMEAAFGAIEKQDRIAQKSKGTWGDFSDNLKSSAKDTFRPLTDIADAAFSVGKGLGVLVGVGVGVVSAIKAISRAFTDSHRIVNAYGDAIDRLPEKLLQLDKMAKDRATSWRDADIARMPGFLQDLVRPNAEIEKLRQDREAITGTQDTATTYGEAGAWEKTRDMLRATEDFLEMHQKNAREAGLQVDPDGKIHLTRQRTFLGIDQHDPDDPREMASKRIRESQWTDGGTNVGNYSTALIHRDKMAAALEKLEQDFVEGKKREAMVQERNLEGMVKQAKDAFTSIGDHIAGVSNSTIAGIGDFGRRLGEDVSGRLADHFDPGNMLKVHAEQQKKGKELKDFFTLMLTGKNPTIKPTIDARGAKITVNTRIDTNDPARFADVAIKSAFLGAAARPLSATMGLGAPMVGGSR